MTYKNIKFDDSSVMRGLEKIAVKNGMVTADPIIKKASPQLDLTPGADLTGNILKLCSGLRVSGFNKYADEIETNFVAFKRAETNLYNSSKETGEDWIDLAHPEGSHSMKNVDGDACIETIVDQDKAIKDMIAKKPTGKLANQSIINTVKITLAQASEIKPHLKNAYRLMNEAYGLAMKSLEHSGLTIFTERGRNEIILNRLHGFTNDNFEIASKYSLESEDYTDFINNIDKFKTSVKPNWFGGVENAAVLPTILAKIDAAKQEGIAAQDLFSQGLIAPKQTAPVPAAAPAVAPTVSESKAFVDQIDDCVGDLQVFHSTVSLPTNKLTPEEKNEALGWIRAQAGAFQALKSNLDKLPENKKGQYVQINQKHLAELVQQNNQFKTDWVE